MAKTKLVHDDLIISKIFLLRGHKIVLDRDLAILYNVTTGNLNKAVKRNIKRFPEDFMFQLKQNEFKNLIFQNGISFGVNKMFLTNRDVLLKLEEMEKKRISGQDVKMVELFS